MQALARLLAHRHAALPVALADDADLLPRQVDRSASRPTSSLTRRPQA